MYLPSDPLSHAGLTLAVFLAAELGFRRLWPLLSGGKVITWKVDYRLVIVGSLLPDLVDKSAGQWILPEIFSHAGRSFAHTLVFNSGVLVLCLFLTAAIHWAGPLVFSLASAGHLLLDRMWESPKTLFWPAYGPNYGGAEFDLSPPWLHWAQTGIGPLLLDGAGALILLLGVIVLLRRRTLTKWLKTGVG